MKPTHDHDRILKSQLVQRQSMRQPAQVQINMLLQWVMIQMPDALLSNGNKNPRSLSNYLSNFVVLYFGINQWKCSHSLAHSLSLSLCIIVGYRQCRQKVTMRRQHFRGLITYTQSLTPLSPQQNHPIQSSIYSSKYKTHNQKGKKNLLLFLSKEKIYPFDVSNRQQIHTSERRNFEEAQKKYINKDERRERECV